MISGRIRPAIALLSTVFLLSPFHVLAGRNDKGNDQGKKHFKLGLVYEQNKQWDKAAQEFTLRRGRSPHLNHPRKLGNMMSHEPELPSLP